jgi:hypothetical protein
VVRPDQYDVGFRKVSLPTTIDVYVNTDAKQCRWSCRRRRSCGKSLLGMLLSLAYYNLLTPISEIHFLAQYSLLYYCFHHHSDISQNATRQRQSTGQDCEGRLGRVCFSPPRFSCRT